MEPIKEEETELQTSSNISIKTINPIILKFSKKNMNSHLFRIGIIKYSLLKQSKMVKNSSYPAFSFRLAEPGNKNRKKPGLTTSFRFIKFKQCLVGKKIQNITVGKVKILNGRNSASDHAQIIFLLGTKKRCHKMTPIFREK